MDSKEIKALIEQYFKGQTGEYEEEKIRDFFQKSSDVPEDLKEVSVLFNYFQKKGKQTTTLSPEDTIHRNHTNFASKRKKIYIFSALAATILLFLGLFLFHPKDNDPGKIYAYINGNPITDKELALDKTRKAISTVSENFNKGTDNLEYLAKFHNAKQLLTKNESK